MKRITDDKILAIGNSTNSCVFAAQLSADDQLAADLKSFRELVEKWLDNSSSDGLAKDLGFLKDDEVVDEVRDTYLLTEEEQDRAIILHREAITKRGEYDLSDETKKYAAFDALCFDQFLKAFHATCTFFLSQLPTEQEAPRDS